VRSGKTLEEHVTGFGVLLGVPIIIGINEFLSSQLTWWELSLGYYKKSFQNFGVSPPPPPPPNISLHSQNQNYGSSSPLAYHLYRLWEFKLWAKIMQ